MQILVISQYFWPESFRLNDMMIGLKEKGHEITVLTGVPNHPQGHFHKGYKLFNFRPHFHNGIKIYRVPIFPRKNGSSFNLVINYLSYTISSTLFGPLFLRKQKFDVVLFVYSPVPEGIPAMLIGKFKKIPIVYWVQDIWPDSVYAFGLCAKGASMSTHGSLWPPHYVLCFGVGGRRSVFLRLARNF